MSGLGSAITNGIENATYNPEAEKAREEDRKKAAEAKQKYRQGLFWLRDRKSQLVSEKKASAFFIKNVDKLANDGFAWITANPDADLQTITNQYTQTSETYEIYSKTNIILQGLGVVTLIYRIIAADAFIKKKITEDRKKDLENAATALENWLKTAVNLTPDQISSKQQEVELASKELLEGTGATLPSFTKEASFEAAKQQAEAKEVEVKKEEEADRNTFKLSRLLKEIGTITAKTVGSLFILMLFLVSGMLTANDVIGRDPQYRILYFIFGGLGFPFMLLYYLYRWFSGTAPHIYRLLPLYTQPADTSLARFFLFPFTYEEDTAARDAKTNFMTAAAKLVGKEYKPPAVNVADKVGAIANHIGEVSGKKLNSIIDGITDLSLNSKVAKKSLNAIVNSMESLSVTK